VLTTTIRKVIEGNDLTRHEAHAAMQVIMRGDATPSQVAGYLVALRMKGETVDEITGSAEAMREAAVMVPVDGANLVDTAGTGGDGAGTINISTAAALVAAGAGVRIAKHGNRSVSSKCGSADVLEALGVTLVEDPQMQAAILEQVGFVFLFAPFQHPAMKYAMAPRKELGVRTVFNVLGPLTNPAGALHQVVGVYDGAMVETLANVLGALGARRALVVHGAGGLDELSTVGPTRVAEWDGSAVDVYDIEPADLGLEPAEVSSLVGGDAAHNAAAIRSILEGKSGPQADIVALNAAAAIYVGEAADGLQSGLHLAWKSIQSGAALQRLDALVEASRGAAS